MALTLSPPVEKSFTDIFLYILMLRRLQHFIRLKNVQDLMYSHIAIRTYIAIVLAQTCYQIRKAMLASHATENKLKIGHFENKSRIVYPTVDNLCRVVQFFYKNVLASVTQKVESESRLLWYAVC